MSNIKRRIEKAEGKVQSMEKETNERKARLLEIQRLEGQDSIRAALLRLEVKYGHPISIADVIALSRCRTNKG